MTHCHIRACSNAIAVLTFTLAAAWALPATAADLSSQVKKSRDDLVSAGMSAPAAAAPAKAAPSALEKAVERLRSIQMKSKEAPAPAAEAPAEAAAAKPDLEKSAEVQPPAQTLQVAADAPDDIRRLPPERVANPLALADALYLGGRLADAYVFYERVTRGETDADTRSWALFQMANCRRPGEPDAAIALYHRVATEFAGSPWARVAAAQERLLQWYQTFRKESPAKTEKPAGKA